MRYFSRLSTVTVLLFGFTSIASCSSAILGIDFGTEYIKAALVKPGVNLEIVPTKDSRRKEASAIAFKPKGPTSIEGTSPERLYGSDALNLALRFPNDVYPNLKPLLGINATDDSVAAYLERYSSLKLATNAERPTVSFQSSASPDGQFALEELVAMQLASIKASGEALAGKGYEITDCTMTVPAYFTSEQRHALQTAAGIAGLRVLTFISDGAAVALNYAMNPLNEFSVSTPPKHHIIYDMGAGSTTASIVKFSGKSVKDYGKKNKTIVEVSVLGVGYDKELGGDLFNQKVRNFLLDKFTNSPVGKRLVKDEGKPIGEILTGKSYAKLWREAGRVRTILSANNDAVGSIESIYPDVDFRNGKITRAEFESMTSEYIDRIIEPITVAIKNAKLPGGLKDIDSLILTGGASRTPFVQKAIIGLVGEERIAKNVNADEAAVIGATFRGAGMSKSFRVKEIRLSDVSVYNVGLRYRSESSDNEIAQTIFNAPAKFEAVKFIPFKRTTDFTFDFYHAISSSKKAQTVEMTAVTTTNLTASVEKLKSDFGCTDANIKTNFEVKLSDRDGLPEVVGGEVSCEFFPKDKKGVVDDVKGFFGFGGKKEEDKVEEETSSKSSKSTKSKKGKSTKTSSSASSPTSTEPVKRLEKINVGFTSKRTGGPGYTEDALSSSVKRLEVFATDDHNRKLREEARNELEGYTYRAQEWLSSESFIGASTKAERDSLKDKLTEVSEWIYTREAEMSTREVLKSKLKDLQNIEIPISKRRKEAEIRPSKIKEHDKTVAKVEKLLAKMKKDLARHEERAPGISEADAKWSSESSLSSSLSSVSSESAASAASAASSSSEATVTTTEASSSSSSESSETTSTSKTSGDALDDLEDETSSSTSTSKTTTTKRPPRPTPAPYTQDEIDALNETLQDKKKWISEKLDAQSSLKLHEDPVLLTQDVIDSIDLLQRRIKRIEGKKQENPYGNYYAPPPKGKKVKMQGPDGMEDIDIEELLKSFSAEELAKSKTGTETVSASEPTPIISEASGSGSTSMAEPETTESIKIEAIPEPKDEL